MMYPDSVNGLSNSSQVVTSPPMDILFLWAARPSRTSNTRKVKEISKKKLRWAKVELQEKKLLILSPILTIFWGKFIRNTSEIRKDVRVICYYDLYVEFAPVNCY